MNSLIYANEPPVFPRISRTFVDIWPRAPFAEIALAEIINRLRSQGFQCRRPASSRLQLAVVLGLLLFILPAGQSVLANSQADPDKAKTVQAGEDAAVSKATDDSPSPSKKEATDAITVGEDDAEPWEWSGRVLDINGQPAAKSVVQFVGRTQGSLNSWSSSVTADEQGEFRARMRIKKEFRPQVKITVRNSDSTQMAYFRFPWNKEPSMEPIEIRLVAARIVRLKVVDKDGEPINQAFAAVQLAYPMASTRIQTGADGFAQFVIPEKERIESAVAWKDNSGLDYKLYSLSRNQLADAVTKAPEFPASGLETLVLEGATPVTVTLRDDDGMPLVNAGSYLWLLKKESEADQLNLGFFVNDFLQRTDENGSTTFQWIPSWQTEQMTFWCYANGYDNQRGVYHPNKNLAALELTVNRLVPIRGHVRDKNDRPVAGVNVSAVGAGHSFDSSRGQAVTNGEGAYEILVAPNQIYLVIASSEGVASAPQTGFAVFKGEPAEDKDFTLRPATRIHGKLIDEETKEPIVGETILIYQYGQDLDSIEGIELPNPDKLRYSVRPITTYQSTSDANGNFEMFVGDGDFDIRPPRQEKAEKFAISGETEREFVVATKLAKEMELVGTVADKSTGMTLAGATIAGVSRNFGGRDWQATTDPQGEFRVKQFPAAAYVHAVSADKKLGAIIEVPAKQPTVALILEPVGSARGRLVMNDTHEPWGGQAVSFGVQVPDESKQTWSKRFGGRIRSAADGTFELTGLVPGWTYELNLDSTLDGRIPSLGKVVIKPGEAVLIGDVSSSTSIKPYVAPTFDERITNAFNANGAGIDRLVKAKALAKLVDQHLLLVYGTPEDPCIRDLMKLKYEDDEFRPIADEFQFLLIRTNAATGSEGDTKGSQQSDSVEKDLSGFRFLLFDASGQKVDKATSDELSVEGKLSREKLVDWFRKHMPEPKDARQLLNQALAEAKKQNKRVLIQETATWCSPCHHLSKFLNTNRIWESDYIWLKIDHRYLDTKELMSELRGEAPGGIPWYAILDSDGKQLASSNHRKSKENIGYPANPIELDHFELMLKSTRIRLTDEDIAGLMKVLAIENK